MRALCDAPNGSILNSSGLGGQDAVQQDASRRPSNCWLRAIPDRARGDAGHGLPAVWPVAVAVSPVAAVIVVLIVAVVMVVVVVMMVVVGMTLTVALSVALAFALAAHLHDVVRAG